MRYNAVVIEMLGEEIGLKLLNETQEAVLKLLLDSYVANESLSLWIDYSKKPAWLQRTEIDKVRKQLEDEGILQSFGKTLGTGDLVYLTPKSLTYFNDKLIYLKRKDKKSMTSKTKKVLAIIVSITVIISFTFVIFDRFGQRRTDEYSSTEECSYENVYINYDVDDRFELLIGAWEVMDLGIHPPDDADEEILEMFISRRVFFEDGSGVDSIFIPGVIYTHDFFTWSIYGDSLAIDGGLLSGDVTLPFRVTETRLFFGYDGSEFSQFLARVEDDEVYLQTYEDLLLGEWFAVSITGRYAELYYFFRGGVGFRAIVDEHECICEEDCSWILSGFYWELADDKLKIFFPNSIWHDDYEFWEARFLMSENASFITIHNRIYYRNPITGFFRHGFLAPNRYDVTENIANSWVLAEHTMLFSDENVIFSKGTYLFSSMFYERITFTDERLLDDLPIKAGHGSLLDDDGYGFFTWMAPSDEFGLGLLYTQFPFYAASIIDGYAYAYTFLFLVDETTLKVFDRDGSVLLFKHDDMYSCIHNIP